MLQLHKDQANDTVVFLAAVCEMGGERSKERGNESREEMGEGRRKEKARVIEEKDEGETRQLSERKS